MDNNWRAPGYSSLNAETDLAPPANDWDLVSRVRRLFGMMGDKRAAQALKTDLDGGVAKSSGPVRASISNLALLEEPSDMLRGRSNASQLLAGCQKRTLEFVATKVDANGHRCWGKVYTTICHGQCESGEYADWLFPYKKSIHKVCGYGKRLPKVTQLRQCSSPQVDPAARMYHYTDAGSCLCQVCSHHDTTCISLMTTPYLSSRPARRRKKVFADR